MWIRLADHRTKPGTAIQCKTKDSSRVLSGIRAAQFSVFCTVFCGPLFIILSFFVLWKITILRQKIIFFPILGGARAGCAPPPWIRPCSGTCIGQQIRIVCRCKKGYRKSYIEEGQAMQWPNEKGQNNKQWSTKNCTEKWKLSSTNPT
jgi:hypothetical protein